MKGTAVLWMISLGICSFANEQAGKVANERSSVKGQRYLQQSSDNIVCLVKAVDILKKEERTERAYRCVTDIDDDLQQDLSFAFQDFDTTMLDDLMEEEPVFATISSGMIEKSEGKASKLKVPKGAKISYHQGKAVKRSPTANRRKRRKDGKQRTLRSQDHRHLAIKRQGVSTVLVLRISAANSEPSLSANEMSNRVFGTNGDVVNLQSVYSDCSFGRLQFIPATGKNIVNGVGEVELDTSINGHDPFVVENWVTAAANAKFGPINTFDHVMFCMPPGTSGDWKAYAYTGWYRSVYNENVCGYASALVHEVGHNLRLSHSREGDEYGDQSCMMGHSYEENEWPMMCFNAHKNWLLGWYHDRSVQVDLDNGPWLGSLWSFVDYNEAGPEDHVLVKVNRFFIQYNKASGFNADVVEKRNQVTITEAATDTSISDSRGALDESNRRYEAHQSDRNGNSLFIELCEIKTDPGTTTSFVTLAIYLSHHSSPCPERQFTDPPSSMPTRFLSRSPTRNLSEPPSIAPSKSPSRSPSLAPTAGSTQRPSPLPTIAPSLNPSQIQSKTPTQTPLTTTPTHTPSMYPTQPPSFSRTPPPTLSPSSATLHPTRTPLLKGPKSGQKWKHKHAPTRFPSILPTVHTPSPSTKASSGPSTPITNSQDVDFPSSAPNVVALECAAGEHVVQVRLRTDDFPFETYWWLTGNTLTLHDGGYQSANTEYIFNGCVLSGEKYIFFLWDGHGDGLCCDYGEGSYIVTLDGVEVASGGEFGFSDIWEIQPRCSPGTSLMKVTVETDFFGSETSWRIYSRNGAVLFEGGMYGPWEKHTVEECVSNTDCVTFEITDEFGDGSCCSFGDGRYTIEFNDETRTSSFEDAASERQLIGHNCPQIESLKLAENDINIRDVGQRTRERTRHRSDQELQEFVKAQNELLDKHVAQKQPPKHMLDLVNGAKPPSKAAAKTKSKSVKVAATKKHNGKRSR